MAEITVSDLTAGKDTLTGTGVFDELMRAVAAHVEQEYSKGRIKGGDYATVYLGALQSVLDRSLQFLLQKQRADLEAELLREQVQKTIKEREGVEASTALTNQQTANAIVEGTVLEAQECKLRAEYDLLVEQKLKSIAETALLNQKKVTEQAQTSGTGVDPNSVIGKQLTLYENQANGFVRDAEQKAAKLLVDAWSVRKTMDDTTPVDGVNKLDDTYIGAAIERLLNGINATMPS